MAEYDHDDDDDNDEDNLALEQSYSAALCPRPHIVSATNVNDTEDTEPDLTILLSINAGLVVGEHPAVFFPSLSLT